MRTLGALGAMPPPAYVARDEDVIPADPAPPYTPDLLQEFSARLVLCPGSSYRSLADHYVAQQYETRTPSPYRKMAFAAGSLPQAPRTLGGSIVERGRILMRHELRTKPQPLRIRKHAFARLNVVPSLGCSASLIDQLQRAGVLGRSRSRPLVNLQQLDPKLCTLRQHGRPLSLHQQGEIKTILLLQHRLIAHHKELRLARHAMIFSAMAKSGQDWRTTILPEFGEQPVGRLVRHFEMLEARPPTVDELLHFDIVPLRRCSEACHQSHRTTPA